MCAATSPTCPFSPSPILPSCFALSFAYTLTEGTTEYTTCDSLLNTSSSTWPESALFEIIANGVDADKLVIGKPATSGDANNGYIAPETLAECLQTAKAAGWSAGAMSWQVSLHYHRLLVSGEACVMADG